MNISFRSIALVAFQYISIIGILLSTSNVARSQAEPAYNPAVLKLIYTLNPAQSESSFLDTILIPTKGDPSAHRIEIDPKRFTRLLSRFYSQVASLRTMRSNHKTSKDFFRNKHYLILLDRQDSSIHAGESLKSGCT